jgi:hypothetical protein
MKTIIQRKRKIRPRFLCLSPNPNRAEEGIDAGSRWLQQVEVFGQELARHLRRSGLNPGSFVPGETRDTIH